MDAPYSVQQLALVGSCFGVSAGKWFDPTTAARVLQHLVHTHAASIHGDRLRVYVAGSQATLEMDAISACARASSAAAEANQGESRGDLSQSLSDRPSGSVLLLVPLMLGAGAHANPSFLPALEHCFTLPWFLGIVGGKPSASLYFLGCQKQVKDKQRLVAFDPHVTQPALTSKTLWNADGLLSLRFNKPCLVDVGSLDPCAMLGFYCRNLEEVEQLYHATQWERLGMAAPFYWAERGSARCAGQDANVHVADDEDDEFTLVSIV
eukprot:NODE_2904_length_1093_cov_22.703065_g2665_i0.p1 GENE.NODE_2904_length_1093_cov_22.703065_g2665_i0~~NODE_2904_length_1093_cov_22.703065_g2665_i0.p1  ORF type:complete len:298 (-),score=53.25 NODE_2904_length_1093_cov_22.703065_g2665_i0:198-992(-)